MPIDDIADSGMDASMPHCDPPCDNGNYCDGVEICGDAGCADGVSPCTGLCDEESDACLECLENEDCEEAQRTICDPVTHTCVECDDNSDCEAPAPYCNPANECVQCLTNEQCIDDVYCDGLELCTIDFICSEAPGVFCSTGCEEDYERCVAPSRVFVTSTTTDGDIGGYEGAVAMCRAAAAAALPDGEHTNFLPWLSTAPRQPIDDILPLVGTERAFVRVDGVLVAQNWAELTDSSGELQAAIEVVYWFGVNRTTWVEGYGEEAS